MNGISGLYSDLSSVKRKNIYTRIRKDLSTQENTATIFNEPVIAMKKTVNRKRARSVSGNRSRTVVKKRSKHGSANKNRNTVKPKKRNNSGKTLKKIKKTVVKRSKGSKGTQNRYKRSKDRF